MHFLGGVRKWIVAVVALLIIVSNISIMSLEASAAEGALTEEQEEFVTKFYDVCVENATSYGLAWQTPMAQAIVESKSGTSNLAEKYHNFHGITSGKGGYRHFSTDEDGWKGYFKNLEVTPVYSDNGIFETGDDPYKMLDVLVESGYAEDESYAKVIGIYIKFIEKWRTANNLPTSSEVLEQEEIYEQNKQAITNLKPENGVAGFAQVIHDIPVSKPVSVDVKEANEPNDPKIGKRAAKNAALFRAIILLWKFC